MDDTYNPFSLLRSKKNLSPDEINKYAENLFFNSSYSLILFFKLTCFNGVSILYTSLNDSLTFCSSPLSLKKLYLYVYPHAYQKN